MTAPELLTYQIDQVGKQIDACVSGLDASGFNTRCAPNGMTPGQVLEHLCEAYEAMVAHARGEKYEWGSFSLSDKSPENVLKVFKEKRAAAVSAALAAETEDLQKSAYDYIVGHDNYHVGQLVLARLQAEPEWDSYAIYG